MTPGGTAPAASVRGRLATFGKTGGIALYPAFFSPSTPPLTTLDGSWHGGVCEALAFDAQGNVYTLCRQAVPSEPPGQVNVFDADATGSAAPTRVITGDQTTLKGVLTDVAVDNVGSVYVVRDGDDDPKSSCGGTVSVFAPGADGNATPASVITGPHTGFACAAAIAVDSSGLVYVGNASGSPLLVFAADATGDAQPIRRIGGRNDIGDVSGIAIDASGAIYATDVGDTSAVVVYGPTAQEGDPPERVITGPLTGLQNPEGVAVDSTGRILVAQSGTQDTLGRISIFSADATGNVPPLETLPNVGGYALALAP